MAGTRFRFNRFKFMVKLQELKIYVLPFFLILFAGLINGQPVTESTASKKATGYLHKGMEAGMKKELDNAIDMFNKAIAEEPEFIEAYMYRGDAWAFMEKDSMARSDYAKVIDLNPVFNVGVYKKIADAEQHLGMYDAAFEHIAVFLENPDIKGETRKRAMRMQASLAFAKDAVKHPVPFNPVNLGPHINKAEAEYLPSISADDSTLVFTRRLTRTDPAQTSFYNSPYNEDFFISYLGPGGWSEAVSMGEPINTPGNEGAQNLSADGSYLFYTVCDQKTAFVYGRCDIYYTFRVGNHWLKPENAGKTINTSDWESQPSVSADGRDLYFASDRPGGWVESIYGFRTWMIKDTGQNRRTSEM